MGDQDSRIYCHRRYYKSSPLPPGFFKVRNTGSPVQDGYDLALRHCQAVVRSWLDTQAMQLKVGEMTSQEVRTVKAVLNSILRSFESMTDKAERLTRG